MIAPHNNPMFQDVIPDRMRDTASRRLYTEWCAVASYLKRNLDTNVSAYNKDMTAHSVRSPR